MIKDNSANFRRNSWENLLRHLADILRTISISDFKENAVYKTTDYVTGPGKISRVWIRTLFVHKMATLMNLWDISIFLFPFVLFCFCFVCVRLLSEFWFLKRRENFLRKMALEFISKSIILRICPQIWCVRTIRSKCSFPVSTLQAPGYRDSGEKTRHLSEF